MSFKQEYTKLMLLKTQNPHTQDSHALLAL